MDVLDVLQAIVTGGGVSRTAGSDFGPGIPSPAECAFPQSRWGASADGRALSTSFSLVVHC